MVRHGIALALFLAACVDVNVDGKNVANYVETVAGLLPPEVVLGWDLRIAAGVAKWRECAVVDEAIATRAAFSI